tara:strand:- start:71 stop:250 length:180 start_codon:yes stop_codon:yes gene_type:complete
MDMMRRYSSTVVVKWANGTLEAEDKEDYIRGIKEAWLEEYGINLSDNDIQDIREETEDV